MLDKLGFDNWASYYEKTVNQAEASNKYPFAGYEKMLNIICENVEKDKLTDTKNILDVGVGTGTLAKKLYDKGHNITAFDFSINMVNTAQEKMPNAYIFEWDIKNGIPAKYFKHQFDIITCTYVLHHFTDDEKVNFISDLIYSLKDTGSLYIGDISFTTKEHLKECRLAHINSWDDDEYYFVSDYIQPLLNEKYNVQYNQISHCGGLYIITKK